MTMVWHIDDLCTVFHGLNCYFVGVQFEIKSPLFMISFCDPFNW